MNLSNKKTIQNTPSWKYVLNKLIVYSETLESLSIKLYCYIKLYCMLFIFRLSLIILHCTVGLWYNAELSENFEFTNYNTNLVIMVILTCLHFKRTNQVFQWRSSPVWAVAFTLVHILMHIHALKPCHVTDLEMVNFTVFKEPMWISNFFF